LSDIGQPQCNKCIKKTMCNVQFGGFLFVENNVQFNEITIWQNNKSLVIDYVQMYQCTIIQ